MRRCAAGLVLVLLCATSLALPAQAATVTVAIGDNTFDPQRISIQPGDSVRWENRGGTSHTVTADDDSFDSGTLAPGQAFTRTFSASATVPYYCTFHGGRGGVGHSGTINVGSSAADPVTRLESADRVGTAVEISRDSFGQGAASAAVLARSDAFADALAGTPLAAAKSGPLLLTPPSALDARIRVELERVLPRGNTVYLLGGEAALSQAVAAEVGALGYQSMRLAGSTRAATAVEVCDRGLGNRSVLLEADGTGFADALAGGAAAARANGCVLLTNARSQAPETASYVTSHPTAQRFALGGAAAAADPQAQPIVGADRFDTAARVAAAFFSDPTAAGIASGTSFPDGLAGGAHAVRKGGPLLLALATDVPAPTRDFLRQRADAISRAFLYGGAAVLSDAVRDCVSRSINGTTC